MPAVNMYKEDTVSYTDRDEKRTFIGSVIKSENLAPDSLAGLLRSPDSSVELDNSQIPSNKPVSPSSKPQNENNSEVQPNSSKIHVNWTCLATGDDYSPISCPIPSVLRSDQLTVLERDHMFSDVVRHAQRGSIGSVVSCRLRAFVELLSYGRAMFDVDCDRLRSLIPWTSRTSENHVVWRGWLGRVIGRKSLAVVRFTDGARLLVRDYCLRDFDPIAPTSAAFPDPVFDGAWLRGDALNLKLDSDPNDSVNLANNLPPGHRKHVWFSDTRSGNPDPVEDPSIPRGHPSRLRHMLLHSTVTQSLLRKPDGMARILDRLPLFLHETKKRNATWLSKLRGTFNVSVFVECLVPIEATVRWLACRNPSADHAPPTLVHGDDLAHLKPVHPYPHLFAAGQDIWYIQLTESDVLYNLKAYDCPEELLYDWFDQNESNLKAVRVHLSSEVDTALPLSTASDKQTTLSNDNRHTDEISHQKKTTPLWAQRVLLNTNRRRYRVFANAKHRLTHSELNRRADQFSTRLQICLTDDDSAADDEGGEEVVNKQATGDNDGTKRKKMKKCSSKANPNASTGSKENSMEALSSEGSAVDGSDSSFDSTDRLLHLRESYLAPLKPGTWVAVGIYLTQTEYDVRWLDGTLERGISCTDLQPVYFNIDEHEFFPGTCVSLKTTSKRCASIPSIHSGDPPKDIAVSDQVAQTAVDSIPRDYGLVLSVNPNERTCVVQWFRTEMRPGMESFNLFPAGPSEEVGVYELRESESRQLTYGSLVWVTSVNTTDDSASDNRFVGFIEDIIPEVGKVTVRWIDGSRSDITRSECLIPLDSLHDDAQWSTDDSDEFESDQLTSDYDSEWETVTDVSSDDGETVAEVATVAISDADSGVESAGTYEEAVRQAADILCQAQARMETIRRLFESHRTFAYWILHRFALIPTEVNTLVNQMATLLGAAATAFAAGAHSTAALSLLSINPAFTTQAASLPIPVVGEMLSPAVPLDLLEESEMLSTVDRLHSIRQLLRQAYGLVHDYRIKKLFRQCDHRRFFSVEYVGGVLQSIALSGPLIPHVKEHLLHSTSELSDQLACRPVVDGANTQLKKALNSDEPSTVVEATLVSTIEQANLRVLVIPKPVDSPPDSEDGWRNRIRRWLGSNNSDELEDAYLVISTTLFTQLTSYLTTTHKRLMEQLTDFDQAVTAWLGEVAPEALNNSISISDDKPTLAGDVVAKTSTEDQQAPKQDIPTDQSSADHSHASVDDVIPTEYRGEFVIEDEAPTSHWFYRKASGDLSKTFHKAWRRDTKLLSTSLPRGVLVKAFSDLMNLFSLLIVGPAGTPYEHGLFLFDLFLPETYPNHPPQVHYYSFATERINPNLYVDGNVCLSLLGTWAGKGSENWDPVKSNLLQLVVSLQGLILNSEPYFNEAGFEACRGSAESAERSRMYNESVIATLVQSSISLLERPMAVFGQEIVQHFLRIADPYAALLEFWASLDADKYAELKAVEGTSHTSTARPLPEFPLAPVTKGFQISVHRNRLVFLDLVSKKNAPHCPLEQ